jgi:hypothetical protein
MPRPKTDRLALKPLKNRVGADPLTPPALIMSCGERPVSSISRAAASGRF